MPRNYNAESLTLSPAATSSTPRPSSKVRCFGPACAARRLFFDETNRGFMGRDVGYYDRTDAFTLDFWFYAAAAYDNVPVINHLAEQNSGRTGYRLTIDDGKLWASLAHSPPANMIAIETEDSLPVGEWTHITLTYDGSSRATGLRLYLNGTPAATRTVRDSSDALDPAVHFGRRVRSVRGSRRRHALPARRRPSAAASTSCAFSHAISRPSRSRSCKTTRSPHRPISRPSLPTLLTATDARVVAARSALTAARARENELATGVPQVLVMGDAPEPTPTFVLNRGVYSEPRRARAPEGPRRRARVG